MISADVMTRAFTQFRQYDATGALPAIRCPTLVVGLRADDSTIALDVMRRVAAAIPGARFRIREGQFAESQFPVVSEADVEAIVDFFDEDLKTSADASPMPHGTAIVLFADIVESTSLTEQLGDAAFRRRARALDDAMRVAVHNNGGAVITANSLGDGILATFPAASQAVAAALALESAAKVAQLQLHVGLHAGDITREKGNVFGGAVNIAARISALSAPGEVLVSDIVRGLARTSAGVTFEDRGEQRLKGIADLVRVFAVQSGDGT